MSKKERKILKDGFETYLQRKIDDYLVRGYLNEKPLEEKVIYLQEVLGLVSFYFASSALPNQEGDEDR
jgi:hypothetical protein